MGRTTVASKESGREVGFDTSKKGKSPGGEDFLGGAPGNAIWQANEVDRIQGDGAELTLGRPPQAKSSKTTARRVIDGGAKPPTDSVIPPGGL